MVIVKSVILKSLTEKEKNLVNKKNALYIEADAIDKELKKCTKLIEYIEEPKKFLNMTPMEAIAFFKTCGLEDEKEIKSTYVRLIHQAMQVGFLKEEEDIQLGRRTDRIDTYVDDLERIEYNIFPEEYDKYIKRLLAPRRERRSKEQEDLKNEMLKLLSKKVAKSGVIYKIGDIEAPIFMIKDRLDKMLRGDASINDVIPITTIAMCYDSDLPLTKKDVQDLEIRISTLTKSK